RPRVINTIVPGCKAIIDIYLPSNFGADALVDILTGDINPSGKLPITYPRYPNSLVSYIHKPSEGEGNPQGGDFYPQWPFGFGLSYTTFAYSDLKINKTTFGTDETATISVTVKNTGTKEGKEVVQLFTSQLVASITPDVKRLRRFEKVDLKPGESITVTFSLPLKELAFVNTGNKKILEAGEFKIQIENLTSGFSVNKTKVF
ncbi:MAG: fibronectin type III-like domain-contianing protein, partial [Ginsengibacter sp.]